MNSHTFFYIWLGCAGYFIPSNIIESFKNGGRVNKILLFVHGTAFGLLYSTVVAVFLAVGVLVIEGYPK